MSTSIESQRDLANTIIKHPALAAVVERVQHRLFKKFITAADDERKVISDIMTSMDLFLKELRVVGAESETVDN